jgi:hypothetical protein
MGYHAREKFKRQLHCTIEKVWDVEHRRLFWYNHRSKVNISMNCYCCYLSKCVYLMVYCESSCRHLHGIDHYCYTELAMSKIHQSGFLFHKRMSVMHSVIAFICFNNISLQGAIHYWHVTADRTLEVLSYFYV